MRVLVLHQHSSLTKHCRALPTPEELLLSVGPFVHAHVVHLVEHFTTSATHVRLAVGGVVLNSQVAIQITDGKKTAATLVAVVVLLAVVSFQMQPQSPGPLETGVALRTLVPLLGDIDLVRPRVVVRDTLGGSAALASTTLHRTGPNVVCVDGTPSFELRDLLRVEAPLMLLQLMLLIE